MIDTLSADLAYHLTQMSVADMQHLLTKALALYAPPPDLLPRSGAITRVAILANDDLYRLLRLCLEQACVEGVALVTVRRYFEFWLLRLSGLFPEHDSCAGCGSELEQGSDVWLHPEEGFRCRCDRTDNPVVKRNLHWVAQQGDSVDTRLCAKGGTCPRADITGG